MASRKPVVCLAAGFGEMPAADVLAVPQCAVAALPTLSSTDRAIAFATNGRAIIGLTNLVLEAAGAGTGCLVAWNGSAWKIAGTAMTVSA